MAIACPGHDSGFTEDKDAGPPALGKKGVKRHAFLQWLQEPQKVPGMAMVLALPYFCVVLSGSKWLMFFCDPSNQALVGDACLCATRGRGRGPASGERRAEGPGGFAAPGRGAPRPRGEERPRLRPQRQRERRQVLLPQARHLRSRGNKEDMPWRPRKKR